MEKTTGFRSSAILLGSLIAIYCEAGSMLCSVNIKERLDAYPAPLFLKCNGRHGWVEKSVVPIRTYFDVTVGSESVTLGFDTNYSIQQFLAANRWLVYPAPEVKKALTGMIREALLIENEDTRIDWHIVQFEIADDVFLFMNAHKNNIHGPWLYTDYRRED